MKDYVNDSMLTLRWSGDDLNTANKTPVCDNQPNERTNERTPRSNERYGSADGVIRSSDGMGAGVLFFRGTLPSLLLFILLVLVGPVILEHGE